MRGPGTGLTGNGEIGQNENTGTDSIANDSDSLNPSTQEEIISDSSIQDTSAITESTETLDTTQQVTSTTDTIQADSTLTPDAEELRTYNSLVVTKKGSTVIYNINNKTYDNLIEGIADNDYTLPFQVKLAGNLTYAEERAIKDILEEKELNFTIQE